MRFNSIPFIVLLSFLFFSLFSPLVFAQGFGEENNLANGVNEGLFPSGNQFGQQAGSAFAQGATSGLDGAIAGLMATVNAIVQIILLSMAVFAAGVFIWLVILLIVLRNIMKRDDLSGGEKAAWVAIVFFFGVLPLSPFGMLLYALSGGKKPLVSQVATSKK